MNELNLPNLFTINQFTKKHPCFPKGGIRYYLFNGQTNGLEASGAVIRIGRKILLDEYKFIEWIKSFDKQINIQGK